MKKIFLLTILLLLSGYTATLQAAEMPIFGRNVRPSFYAQQATPTPTGAAPTATPTPAGPQPGTTGIGDPYDETLGNGGYDVAHYTLELEADMAGGVITGTMTMTATTTQALNQFNLDFQGFEISAATVNGRPAEFIHTDHELTLIPAEPLPQATEFSASVAYSGIPQPVPAVTELPFLVGWFHEEDVVYVAGKPNGAAAWYPVNDHPQDKASYTFRITVPKPFVVAANGLLQETTEQEETITYVWEVGDPLASYLVTVSIGHYVLLEDVVTLRPGDTLTETAAIGAETGSEETSTLSSGEAITETTGPAEEIGQEGQDVVSLPIRHYFPAAWQLDTLTAFSRTVEMIEYFSGLFGPYPFEAYGVVVVDTDWPYALESQTLPVIGGAGLLADPTGEQLAAEMLAHQWFGASVSPHYWQDIWLSDGFAAYAVWLWIEHSQGPEALDALVRDHYSRLTAEGLGPAPANLLSLPPGNPPAQFLFNSGMSERGALALHALRLRLGDETFFKVLQSYAARYRHSTAGTADFIGVAEEMSGQPLAEFFEVWLYAEAIPAIPEMNLFGQAEATLIIPSLRIRSGPGTAYSILGAAAQGETVQILGQAYDCQWLEVETAEGLKGWISGAAEYVTLSQPCQALPEAEIPSLPSPTPAPASPRPTPRPETSSAQEHFERGLAFFEEHRWEQAIPEFQAAIGADSNFGLAYRYLGYSYANQKAYEPAVKALEQYLQLVPKAEDRAKVEGDLAYLRLAATIPPGKALFVFTNYTNIDWTIDVGPHQIALPPWTGGAYPVGKAILDPGTYTWQGHSVGGGYYITDGRGNRSFQFTVVAGDIYAESVR